MSSEQIDTNSLPFSLDKQRAVLGHSIYDERFFGTVIGRIEPEWFSEPIVCRVYDALKRWYKKWNRQPTINELLECEWLTKLSTSEIQQIQGTVALVKREREKFPPPPLLGEMEAWVKTRLIQLALPKAAMSFNKRDIESSVNVLNSMIKEFHEIQFLEDGEATFDNYGQELIKENNDRTHAMTFGLSAMDRLIDPYGLGGSLMPGGMTVILAPTNVGKTSVLVTIACHNIAQGKSVLFLSHEGREDEIKNKFMRCLTGMNPPQLLRAYMDPSQIERLKACEEIFKRFLVYKHMAKPGLTVEEVAATVERYQDKRRLSTGKGFDLMIDDYPAKLSTNMAREGHLQHRHIQELVYGYFVSMGSHHKFHVVTAVQTNREGSKVNRRQGNFKHETRLLHMEDVMEAWGIVTQAEIVISVNRNSDDAELNKLTFLLCKSRTGEAGWAVVCNTDYSACRTHGNDLGCFWYRGEDGLGDKSSDIMNAFKGQAVPSEKIRWYEDMGT